MAYTATVTKESVKQDSKRDYLYTITIKMVVNDGESDVFEKTASADYNDRSPDLSAVKSQLISQLSAKWDLYAAENNLYTAAAFDTMLTQIGAAANTYVQD